MSNGSSVVSIACQANGSLIVGGYFASTANQTNNYIARLDSGGNADGSFNVLIDTNLIQITPTAYVAPHVESVAIDPEGRVLLAGFFKEVNFTSRANLARLFNTAGATSSLVISNLTINWIRGQTSPEFSITLFEGTTNGSSWFGLGTGKYVNGHWQLPITTSLTNLTIRARGLVQAGFRNASTWVLEESIGPAAISSQPGDSSNAWGGQAVLEVQAAGAGPMSYQWFKDGNILIDGGTRKGSQSSRLVIDPLTHADSGRYWAVISNAQGSVISSPATLVVMEPFFISQPTNVFVNVGSDAVLAANAVGTPPIMYEWLRNGTQLIGETAATLLLTNVQLKELGVPY